MTNFRIFGFFWMKIFKNFNDSLPDLTSSPRACYSVLLPTPYSHPLSPLLSDPVGIYMRIKSPTYMKEINERDEQYFKEMSKAGGNRGNNVTTGDNMEVAQSTAAEEVA